ncbi:MAG: shikimate dehydrogenase [Candidatus Omnitrophica bacterium]|nr:shikimate dehydrogenase [Candidatus Omnitrophota bacterium]
MNIYGVIGWPIKHSLSPAMHNAAFKKFGFKAEYKLFEVRPEELKNFIINRKNIAGFNITVPHKEKCIELLDSIDPLAGSIGAVNTVVIKNDKLIGYNTDSHGFITALEKDLEFKVKGKSIFLLGSGGASRAVSFALAANGAKKIVLTDLFLDKVKSLAENIRKFYPICNVNIIEPKEIYMKNDLSGVDLLINATPIGLKKDDPLLFDKEVFKKGLSVYDLVYNPERTKLMEAAKNTGLKFSGGLGMLLYQGAKSFELWTGEKAPIEVMRNALIVAIKP